MDQLTENRPDTCASLGLECSSCIRQSATTVATLCQDLQPSGIHRIFVQLYPSTGCLPMAHAFQLSYLDAAVPNKPMARAQRADAAAA